MTVIYENGTVLPLDQGVQTSEALVTRDGRVMAHGPRENMRDLAGPDAERVDLAGGTLLPGLVDSHPHAMHMAAGEIGFVNVLGAKNHDDVCRAIAAALATAAPGEWIRTTPVGTPHYFVESGWRDLVEGVLPDRHVLDRVAPENPVHIMAWAPTTPNVCAFNTAALRALGLTRHHPVQIGGITLERDAEGELTGRLFGKVNNYYNDDPFWHRLAERLPPGADDLWVQAGLLGQRQMSERGVTAIYEAHAMMPPHIEAYQQLRRSGQLTTRVLQSLELSTYVFNMLGYTEEEIWRFLDLGASLRQVDDELCRINGVTLSRGGPAEQGFLRMHGPYFGPDGSLTTGRTFYERHVEQRVLRECLERDVRLNMVLGGLRDHDEFIQSCSELEDEFDIAGREWVLQHCMVVSQEQVDALAKYRFHATLSVSFVWGCGELFRERFGAGVLADLVPLKRFEDSAMNLSCGTDWGPGNIFHAIALNETREMAGSRRNNRHEDHIITREQALRTYTVNGARMMQWPDIGSLKPGHHADLVIVDRNPLTTHVDDLPDTRVQRTVLGGNIVHDIGAVG